MYTGMATSLSMVVIVNREYAHGWALRFEPEDRLTTWGLDTSTLGCVFWSQDILGAHSAYDLGVHRAT